MLDVGPMAASGAGWLGPGVQSIVAQPGAGLPLGCTDETVDLALRLGSFSGDLAEMGRWLAELRRVLTADGICAVRVAGPGSQDGFTRAAFVGVLERFFFSVLVLDESPFLGVMISAPGSDDVAIHEGLAPAPPAPAWFLALCAKSETPSWQVGESLLVPVSQVGADDATAAVGAARIRADLRVCQGQLLALSSEAAELRERLMAGDDGRERVAGAALALRRESERNLSQIAMLAQTNETLGLERDRALAAAASANRARDEVTVRLRRHEVAAAAMERELIRLRAKVGALPG